MYRLTLTISIHYSIKKFLSHVPWHLFSFCPSCLLSQLLAVVVAAAVAVASAVEVVSLHRTNTLHINNIPQQMS